MNEIYHGSTKGYKGGLHKLMKKDQKCFIPTTDCFWKDPHDVIDFVKTCSQTEEQKIIGWKSMKKKREKENSI